MLREPKVYLFDLISALSEAVDLVSPAVGHHHFKVAYASYSLGKELKLPSEDVSSLLLAGMLHDIGAISLKERLDVLRFETDMPHKHSELGYMLVRFFNPFKKISEIIRFHHVKWNNGDGKKFKDFEVPLESHIIHLADRVSVLIDEKEDILNQRTKILSIIENQRGKMFHPELIDALQSLSQKEYFWLDLSSNSIDLILPHFIKKTDFELDKENLTNIAKLFSRIIDFRSPFTAAHSAGVAACAFTLAKLTGFSQRECFLVEIAGYLHDLGKLAVPPEILEKPDALTNSEYNIIRKHPFYTYRILDKIHGFEEIKSYASYHHETLSGNGYPFHIDGANIPYLSRILAAADIYTAVTEDRPYRSGMSAGEAVRVLNSSAAENKIDKNIVHLLINNLALIQDVRITAQEKAKKEYSKFKEHLQE